MKRGVFIAGALLAAAWGGAAQADSMSVAMELGNVLGSEAACELTFDAAAIERFVESHVAADDMAFAGRLQMMTAGSEMQVQEMSASARIAHCAQIRRVARSNGFIEE